MIRVNIHHLDRIPIGESNAPIPHSLARTVKESGNYGLADEAREMAIGRGRRLQDQATTVLNARKKEDKDLQVAIKALEKETGFQDGDWADANDGSEVSSGKSKPAARCLYGRELAGGPKIQERKSLESFVGKKEEGGKGEVSAVAALELDMLSSLGAISFDPSEFKSVPICHNEVFQEDDEVEAEKRRDKDIYNAWKLEAFKPPIPQPDTDGFAKLPEASAFGAVGGDTASTESSNSICKDKDDDKERKKGVFVNFGGDTFRRVIVAQSESFDDAYIARYERQPWGEPAEEVKNILPPKCAVYVGGSIPCEIGRGAVRNTKEAPKGGKGKASGYVMFLQYMKRTNKADCSGSVSDLICMFDKDWKALTESEKQMWKERAKTGRKGGVGGGGGSQFGGRGNRSGYEGDNAAQQDQEVEDDDGW